MPVFNRMNKSKDGVGGRALISHLSQGMFESVSCVKCENIIFSLFEDPRHELSNSKESLSLANTITSNIC